jgi:hypothetical protein
VVQQETHQGQGDAALVPGHYSGYLETQAGSDVCNPHFWLLDLLWH